MLLGSLNTKRVDLTRQNLRLVGGKPMASLKDSSFLNDYYYEQSETGPSTAEKKYQAFKNWYVGQGNDQTIKNIIKECKYIVEHFDGSVKNKAQKVHDEASALHVKYQNWLVSGPNKNRDYQ